MRKFFRNILRTIVQNKVSYIGAVLIIALGAMIYTALTDFLKELESRSNKYFNDTEFADVFVEVEAMPEQKITQLKDIKGVRECFGRLEGDVRLVLEGESKITTLHVMAYTPEDKLNYLITKPNFENAAFDDIYISKRMCDERGININDRITVIAKNRTKHLYCRGYAYSSERMSSVADESAVAPDSSVFDVAVMSKDGAEKLLSAKGEITNIGIRLEDGYSYSDVKYSIEQALKSYSVHFISAKKDQESYSEIESELDAYTMIVLVLPTIFMAVTVFMLYIVLRKMIDKDRILIGTMKAFGASDLEILFQYMKQAVVIGLVGGVLLLIPAEYVGEFVYVDDAIYFNLPDTTYTPHISTLVSSICFSLATSIISVYMGVRGVVKITPAESMRAAAPKGGGSNLPKWVSKVLNSRQKIGLTSMLRNKGRSLIIAIAVAFPFSAIAAFGSYNLYVNQTVDDRFEKMQDFDLQVKFTKLIDLNDANTLLRSMKDIESAEAAASYPVTITGTNRYEYSTIMVLNNDSKIYRIMDRFGGFTEPRDDGLIMSHHLANKLGVKAGDLVTVEGNDLTYTNYPVKVPIVEILDDQQGTYSFINQDGIERYFPVKKKANLLLINPEEGKEESVKSQISKLRNISVMFKREEQKKSFGKMMGTVLLVMNFIAGFATIAGVVMIYNILGISMRERKNEFGTLMVLGMTRKEISEIIIFEQMINLLFGLLVGLPWMSLWCKIIEFVAQTDTETVTMQIYPQMFILALVVCLIVTVISVALVIRDVFNIELTDVLKERE